MTWKICEEKREKTQCKLHWVFVLLLKLPILCYSTIIIVTKNIHYSITPFRRNTANLSYKFCNNYFNSKYHKCHLPFIKGDVFYANRKIKRVRNLTSIIWTYGFCHISLIGFSPRVRIRCPTPRSFDPPHNSWYYF